jgi:hypothetical protein
MASFHGNQGQIAMDKEPNKFKPNFFSGNQFNEPVITHNQRIQACGWVIV